MLSVFEGPVKILKIGKSPVLYLVQYLGSKRKKWYTHVSKLKPYLLRDNTKLGLPTNTTSQVPTHDHDASSSESDSESQEGHGNSRISDIPTHIPNQKPGTSTNTLPKIPNKTRSFPQSNRMENNQAVGSPLNLSSVLPQLPMHSNTHQENSDHDMPVLTPYTNMNFSAPHQISLHAASSQDIANQATRIFPLTDLNQGDNHHHDPTSQYLPAGTPPPTHGYFLRQRK